MHSTSTLEGPAVHVSPPRSAHRVPRTVGFVAISASLLAFFAAAGAPTPLLPLYERSWGFAPSLLTLAFGVYALAMIVSLLVVGALSDHIGRRPVLVGSLALELISMVVFLFAPSIWWVILARVLQGLATGVASSTFSAAVVELAPERRKRLGAVMSSLATTAGLGLGALFSGLVALAAPTSAGSVVWTVLIVVMAAGTAIAVLTPETSARKPGAIRSLVPKVVVPASVRRLFGATAPSVIATFLETALFLGLVPTILAEVFGVTVPIIGGLVNFAMFTAATLASLVTSSVRPHRLKVLGNAGMVVGSVVLIGGIAAAAIGLIWVAAVVAGAGMGAAFSGAVRGLVPEVPRHQRAGLLAAVFTVAYLTFGGSAILAGYVAATIGEKAMAVGFTVVLVLVALLGTVLSARVSRRRGAPLEA